MTGDRRWWRRAVVYQIYPRSFNDADGDGVGDLRGVVERVDYLEDLGVDVVWLNPVYDSPQVDNGYDVRDYRSIHREFGTMTDWERLRDRLHGRDIRLVMDLPLNHTSDEHEWFRRSRRGEVPYRDYYIWEPGDPDEPPNNWRSLFGHGAWSYDDEREAWYLHLFDERMPDLDWSVPAVRAACHAVMEWWLDKGIDGFRLDVVNLLSKPADLPDGDPTAALPGADHFVNGPNAHAYVREMHERVFAGRDIVTVGETFGVTPAAARRYVVEDGLDMVFPFEHMHIDAGGAGPWDVADWDLGDLQAVTERWQTGLDGGWIGLYLGNHDQPRPVSRFGDDGDRRVESAKLLATFLFTLRGTPFVYQGEELGMTNAPFDRLEEYRDPATILRVEAALGTGDVEVFEEIRDAVNYWSRDNARTPMQWSAEDNAGFTTGDPWIKVNPNYPEINVEREAADEGSVLAYYRRLIELRAAHPVLVDGRYEAVAVGDPVSADDPATANDPMSVDDSVAADDSMAADDARSADDSVAADDAVSADDSVAAEDPAVMAYRRTHERGAEEVLVVLNFFDGRPSFEVPADVEFDAAELLIANYDVDAAGDPRAFDLRPYEARVYRLPGR